MTVQSLDTERLHGFRVKVATLSAFGLFLDGYDLTVIAVALPYLEKQWHFSGWMDGLVGASALIGMLIGASLFGWVTDRLGRKAIYLFDLIGFVVFALLTAAAQDVWQLVACRLLLGVAIGADYPISASLTAEFSTSTSRGKHIARMSMAYGAGAVIAFVLGALLTTSGPNAWRWLLLVGAAIALVVCFLRRTIPESPLWLQSRGRTEESQAVVRQLLGSRSGDTVPVAEPAPTAGAQGRRWPQLFGSGLLGTTLFVCGFYFFFSVAFYGIGLYTPTIVGGLSDSSARMADFGAAAISFVGIIGQYIGSFLLENWGRRPTVLLGFAGQAIPLVVLALVATPPYAAIVTLIGAAIILVNIGPGVVILLYPSELYPTALRASGVGFSVAVSRIGAILGVIVFPQLVVLWGTSRALWIFIVCAVLGFLLCLARAPETRNTSLEQ